MHPLIKPNRCGGCGRCFLDNEQVIALIPHVIVTNGRTDHNIRLKLSPEAIDNRAITIYCEDCLSLDNFVPSATV